MTPAEVWWLHDDAHPHVVLTVEPLTLARITTNITRAKAPGCVLLEPGEANLPKQSVVLSFSVITTQPANLREHIGAVSAERLEEIHAARRFIAAFG